MRCLGFSVPEAGDHGPFPPGWKELCFDSRPRPTVYRVLPRGEEGELLAMSSGGASILYTTVRARETDRELCWEWRVDRMPAGGDVRTPAADDAGARVYVGFEYHPGLVPRGQRLRYTLARLRYGETPPYAGLVYVWASEPEAGSAFVHREWPRLGVLVLHDGRDPAGVWRRECRDVTADFRAIFGAAPPRVSHVGVMTDADDTGSRATARYRRITLGATSPAPPRPGP